MSVAAPQDEGVYARSLCTGFGDRLGMLLALAAVARAYNLTQVTMGWCVDPMGVVRNNPLHLQHIPGWTGYDYPLPTLRERMHLPDGVHVVWSDVPQKRGALVVSDMGSERVPPTQGLPFLPWLGHEIFAVGDRPRVTRAVFEAAYADAGRQLRAKRTHAFDVVVHLRAWDHNHYTSADYTPAHYCTRKALERIVEAVPWLTVAVLSHNRTWARKVLGPRLRKRLLKAGDVLDDLGVLLAARRGIVQHAAEGWSAFSSVPSLARRVPLLSTYDPPHHEHRHAYFARFAPIPSHWMRCADVEAFIAQLLVGELYAPP
jgi:hypothetical protein